MVRILFALIFTLTSSLGAQQPHTNVSGGPLKDDQAWFDVQHYTLRVAVNPEAQRIAGTLTMTATARHAVRSGQEFGLDLDDAFEVHAVRSGGGEVDFDREHGRIVLEMPDFAEGAEFEVEVVYDGAPVVAKNPPWTGGFTWSKTSDGAPWIATSCQGEGADLWWPCKDHPSDKPESFDLYCTVPEGLVVASNGTEPEPPTTKDGRTTFHWHSASPIANYSVALNIAPYVELRDTFTCIDGTEMPIRFFVLPSSKRKAKRCMPQFLDHIKVFEQLLGPYPFRHEKYGIAETPHLGMEHQTIIAYGNGFRDEQWDWLHNHELSHEWWGNLVTCRDWKDMWLHEGFGTYMQPLYRELRFGREAYDTEVHAHRTMSRRPIAPREVQDSKQIYFGGGGNDIYYKGSLVLHTLRWQLGEEKFFEVLKRFAYPTEAARKATDGSQCRFVDTEDFVSLCNEVAGEDLGWFFEVYVRSAGLPRLEYRVVDGVLKVAWKTPGDLPFPLKIPVTFGDTEVIVPMPDGLAEIPVGEGEFALDPNGRVLKARSRELR